MKRYELLYILPPNLTEEEAAKKRAPLLEKIKERGAVLVREDHLGKKKLAYPIKKQTHGYYELVAFDAEPAMMEIIEKDIRLMGELLRHTIVHLDARAIKAGEKQREAIPSRSAYSVAEESPENRVRKAPEERKPPVDQKVLDEKIEELLEAPEMNL